MMIMIISCIVVFTLCLAVMDNIASYDTFGKYFKSKGYNNLAFWFENDGWENKYQLKEWLMKIGITEYIATYYSLNFYLTYLAAFVIQGSLFKKRSVNPTHL